MAIPAEAKIAIPVISALAKVWCSCMKLEMASKPFVRMLKYGSAAWEI